MNASIKKSKTPVPTAKKPARARPATPEEIEAAKKGAPITEEPATASQAPVTESFEVAATEPEAAPEPAAKKKGRAKKEPTDGDQKPTPPPGELVVFALRLTLEERQALHATAGPAKASRFARAILVAAANRDVDAVRQIIEATTPKQ